MNTRSLPGLLVSFLFLFTGPALFAQLEFKLEYLSGQTWGVFVKPDGTVDPSDMTITGSGQVTVVMPSDFQWYGPQNFSGNWTNNALYADPVENEGRQYVSFGLQSAEPLWPVVYKSGEETLLFTFKTEGNCPDFLYLIDCNTPNVSDPFCPDFPDSTPGTNSQNSNPGNDLSVVDFGVAPTGFYNFSDNYALNAWKCDGPKIFFPGYTTGEQASHPSGEKMMLEIPAGEQPGFHAYPNPADAYVQLNIFNLKEGNEQKIRLYNLQGVLLHEQTITSGYAPMITLVQWPSGMYLLTLETDGQVVQQRKLVKR